MTIQPIHKSLVVPLPKDRAFRLFTEGLADWWPVESHSISAGQKKRPQKLAIEPRLNGQIIETLEDGSTTIWGHFSAWAPPDSLILEWYVGRTRELATQVSVNFEARGDETVLTLVHDGFEAMGDDGPDMSNRYQSGWDPVLACFQAIA
ncbi:MAG: SRPBCC domain-containing protein [Paracoccaceae bacterium]